MIERASIKQSWRFGFAVAVLAFAAMAASAQPLQDIALRQTATAPFAIVPVSGAIGASFGPRIDPGTGRQVFHAGVDIRAAKGTPVLAPADGRVSRVASDPEGYGNLIEIDHGDGLTTRYARLSGFNVEAGASVRAGDVIAFVGDTGPAAAEGSHLHFEVWRGERVDDPALYLQALRAAD